MIHKLLLIIVVGFSLLATQTNLASLFSPFPNTFEFYRFCRKENHSRVDSFEHTVSYLIIFPFLFEGYANGKIESENLWY